MKKIRRWLVIPFIGWIIWILITYDLTPLMTALTALDPWIVVLLLLLQLFTFALMSHQWLHLLRVKGHHAFLSILNILFASAFTEGITPSVKFGSEAVKGYLLMQRFSLNTKAMVKKVAVQKIISISALVPFILVTVWLWWSPAEAGVTIVGLSLLGLLILTGLWVMRTKFAAMAEWSFKNTWFHYRLSFAIWALFYTKGWLLSIFMGFDLSAMTVLLVVFVPYLAALVPITPGGIGTFEAAMVSVLVTSGITAETAIVFALVFRLVTFWFGSAVGAGCILWDMYQKDRSNPILAKTV